MKRPFLVLLLVAVGVWGYVALQIAQAMGGRGGAEEARIESPALAAGMLREGVSPPDTGYRDPFQSFLYREKPKPKFVAKAAPKVIKVVSPPQAALSGILWGDQPVAILKVQGKTELLKAGDEAWDFKVVRIERHQVTVVKEGRQFTIGY